MQPTITIVTVSFNTREIIESTIQSVLMQDYDRLEYIIIDGGSTDGTQAIIEGYRSRLAHYVSEKDGGIYYGMNKGIDAATGDYLLFLNAGDVFVDSGVVSDMAQCIDEHPEGAVFYGNSEQVLEYGTYLVIPRIAYINRRMCISHQATFVRTDLLRSHKFNTQYRYAADYEQISSLYLSGIPFVYFNRTIARVEMTDGTTYRHFIDSANELYDIIEARGIDISKERKSQIRRKKLVRAFKSSMPRFIRIPVLRFLAKHYKAL